MERSSASPGRSPAKKVGNVSKKGRPLSQTQTKTSRPTSYLAPLRSTKLLDSERTPAALPAEILAMIIDYSSVPDLIKWARTSKRMREMVYDDTRWVQKLQMIGCWDEREARRRQLDESRRRGSPEDTKPATSTAPTRQTVGNVKTSSTEASSTGWEEHGPRKSHNQTGESQVSHLTAGVSALSTSQAHARLETHDGSGVTTLHVLENVRSVRGQARHEYGKVHGALAPYYNDVARARSHSEPAVFKEFRDPEHQAKMLAQLRNFAKSDHTAGWQRREESLESMIAVFENAVLREFERGYKARDVDGTMRKYAHVLVTLNGGAAGIDLYIHDHWLMQGKDKLGHPLACLRNAGPGNVDLTAVHDFFEKLSVALNEESGIIDRVFPESTDVLTPFLRRVCEDMVSEYATTLLDEAHTENMDVYLKVVAGVAEQSFRFVRSVTPAKSSPRDFYEIAIGSIVHCFEPHVDLYLREELDHFEKRSNRQVDQWDKKLSAQEASAESFFMSNITRQAAKQDFMSSFKKVVMMPVNTIAIPFAALSKASDTEPNKDAGSSTQELPPGSDDRGAPTPAQEAPTTELAAKAAIMNSKLEGIGTLFSLEVALDLVHSAKASIERAAIFVNMGGRFAEETKEQCEAIFMQLLQILGFRHIKSGFDKAVGHLAQYNAQEAQEHGGAGTKPLITFLELVNVGDLIQQMIDVFYQQELVATKLTDPDDFLNPAGKEKKRFEQMLDERVAAGLNTGLDVLVNEITRILDTVQTPADFNPGAGSSGTLEAEKHSFPPAALDIGPTAAATQVIALVSSHTAVLTGSTDKNTLDVFNQEVGLRLFTALCKHVKRQRVSTTGAVKLIADMNAYFDYILTLKNKELLQYFVALRELSQIFLIDVPPPRHGRTASSKEIAAIVADAERYRGLFRAEEVLEFAERRADWYSIRPYVEKALYGIGCSVM